MSPGPGGAAPQGILLTSNLEPNTEINFEDESTRAYTAMLHPEYVYPGATAGQYTILAVESFNGFGVSYLRSPFSAIDIPKSFRFNDTREPPRRRYGRKQ